MAELQPGHYTQAACHTAQGDRQVLNSLLCSEGVDLAANALVVTTAGSGLGVNVAAGGAFVLGDSAATQGYYHVYNDATVVKTHAAADPTNPRIDLVIARVNDAAYSGVSNTWTLEIVTGVAAPAPVAPAAPVTSIILAQVLITAGLTGPIPSGNITDTRTAYKFCAENGSGGWGGDVIYTAGDTFDKADYPGLTAVKVTAVGGGGGGAGAGAGVGSTGSGGGGGGTGRSNRILVGALAASETITIGTGGAGGVGNNPGATGNTSSFGAHCTGLGGVGGTSRTTTAVAGGAGGSGTPAAPTGTVQLGEAGGYAYMNTDATDASVTMSVGGRGGSSALGAGGSERVSNGGTGQFNGVGGSIYGGGGGGALAGTLAANGGAGAAGVVIVELFF